MDKKKEKQIRIEKEMEEHFKHDKAFKKFFDIMKESEEFLNALDVLGYSKIIEIIKIGEGYSIIRMKEFLNISKDIENEEFIIIDKKEINEDYLKNKLFNIKNIINRRLN